MPRKLLRRYLPEPSWLGRQRSLRYALGELIHEPNLWHLNRRSVSGGVAIGVFVAWVPLPIQMLTAAALSLLFRANLPLGVLFTWVSNPLTLVPMYWTGYRLGSRLLGHEAPRAAFEPSLRWLTAEFTRIWQPLLLGSVLLGLLCAGLAYALIRLLWRWQVVRQTRQRARDRDRARDGRPRCGPRRQHQPPRRE